MFSYFTELYFKDLAYTDIYVDGEINGVQNLSLGQGVNFVIGENVCQNIIFWNWFKIFGQLYIVSDFFCM